MTPANRLLLTSPTIFFQAIPLIVLNSRDALVWKLAQENPHYQLNYLRVAFQESRLKVRLRANWISRIIYPAISVMFFLSIWELLVWFFEVPLWLVPKPTDFLNRFFSDFPLIADHGAATSVTIISGFLLGIFVAVPLALLIVSSNSLQRGLYPVIVFLNIMPKQLLDQF